jgi:hypothetical protein
VGLVISLGCGWLLLQSVVLIPRLGIQNDEALFANGIFPPMLVNFAWKGIPLMVMAYLGALKTWLYAPLLALWPPGPFLVRLPMALAAAGALWLFVRWIRQGFGRRPAMIAGALVATDATYLLTATFDWGPVALQHLLLAGALCSVLTYYKRRSTVWLAAGFFLMGLALWNKAVFVWIVSGLAVATVVVYRREVRSCWSVRAGSVALAAFVLGALPLISYNLSKYGDRYGDTFVRHTRFSTEDLGRKLRILQTSLDGGGLLGYLVRDEPYGEARPPQSRLERASVTLNRWMGAPRAGFFFVAVVAALALVPVLLFTPVRRSLLWSLTALAVAYPQMLFNQDSGAGAHHVVLLWPLPHLVVALALTQAAAWLGRRGPWIAGTAVAVVCASNVVLTNQYLAHSIEFGPGRSWSNAIEPLAGRLESRGGGSVYMLDWGIFDTLRLLGRGRIPIDVAWQAFLDDKVSEEERAKLKEMLETPGAWFATHAPAETLFLGVRERLVGAAAGLGYYPTEPEVFHDSHGRPIFELFRFEASPGGGAGGSPAPVAVSP